MKKITSLATIALLAWVKLGTPCRAQSFSADIPLLKQYVDVKWIYFAPAGDQELVFEKGNSHVGSNVWVAVERASTNRRILAKTDVWTDVRGRPHTLSVLKLQLEFNDQIREEQRLMSALPNGIGVVGEFGVLALPDGIGMVGETGVLDHNTLAIPYTKLYLRAKKMSNRLDTEHAAIGRLAVTDPSGAALQTKYVSYWSEKIGEALSRLRELNDAVRAVPLAQTTDELAVPRAQAARLDGLSGLEIPNDSTYNMHSLKVVNEGSGTIHYVSVNDALQPERYLPAFVDPLHMTPAVVADLQAKEAAAARAVDFAERLCKDLLTPPCP